MKTNSDQAYLLKPGTSGQVLVLVVIFLAVITVLSVSLFASVASFVRFGRISIAKEQATHLAEAGIDKAVWQLNETEGAYTGENNTLLGVGAFTIQVTGTGDTRLITTTGCIPNCNTPQTKKVIKVEVTAGGIPISFPYAIQAGNGSLKAVGTGGSQTLVTGNVYSNDEIDGSNCDEEGEPFCVIDGNAWAKSRIDNWQVSGTKQEGAPEIPFPSIDVEYWKAQAVLGETIDCRGSCKLEGSEKVSWGPVKIEGSVDISDSAELTVTGPIHITGSLEMRNSAKIALSDTFGSSGTVVIADSHIKFQQSSQVLGTDSDPRGYILFIVEKDGEDIKATHSTPNMKMYAVLFGPEGTVEFKQNTELTGAVVARKVRFDRIGADVTYDENLLSATFSSGSTSSWRIVRGTYRFAD